MGKCKYAVHPGEITSVVDGEKHFVGFAELCSLYEINPRETIAWDDINGRGRRWDDYIHLFPKRDGQYSRGGR